MDWYNRFPFLVPVWHSLSTKNLKISSQNRIDPNFNIDLGGIGTFNGLHLKNYQRLPYHIDRPMLPFFINENEQNYSKFSAYNCLAFCPKRKLLFSSKNGQINVLCLKDDNNNGHRFTNDRSTFINPFVYDIDSVYTQQMMDDNILDIKLYENNSQTEILTHSRKSLGIYQYKSYEIEEKLTPITKSFKPWHFFPSSESVINKWDRNQDFRQQILTTFIEDPNIYRNDIEKQTMFVENVLNVDMSQPRNQFINLEYMKNFNPFLYLYGTHQNIWLGDTRVNLSGEKQQQKSLVNCKEFVFFKSFELFHAFNINPIDPHQFITTSDFNINFFDIRYPNKNLFQVKHMISDKLVNQLLVKKIPSNQSNDTLILMASNYIKTCFLTFNPENIQPKMLHVPFSLDTPLSINESFPFMSENQSFIRGMQILPKSIDNSSENSCCFSIAFLMNNGNILLQDFWPKSTDTNNDNSCSIDDFMYENNVGNKFYLNSEFDVITKQYMNEIIEYLNNKIPKINNNSDKKEFCHKCNEELICTTNFCQCLSNEPKSEELELIDSDVNNLNDILSTENSTIAINGKLCFRDDDSIDFEFIKQNWFHVQNDSTKNGIRQYCRPLTRKLFDKWILEETNDDHNESNNIFSNNNDDDEDLIKPFLNLS